MINEFLGPRLDFILFVQALCLFFLALFSLDQARERRSQRWLWLALFAAAQSLGIALYLISRASVDGEAVKYAGWSLHALAAFFLGLYGLNSLPLGRTRTAGFMGAGVLLVLPAAGAAIWGMQGFLLAQRLGLGPVAGILALAGLAGPAWRGDAPRSSGSLRALLALYLFCAEVLPGAHVMARLAKSGAEPLHENLPPLFYAVLLAATAACAATVFARTLTAEAEPSARRKGLHAYAIGLVAVAFAVFMGFTVTDTLGRQAEQTLRGELFMRVAAVGNALDPEQVAQLKGEPTELHEPYFVRLLRQLTKIRLGNPDLRYVYITTLRLRDRTVLLALDTEPPTSENYILPGEPYPEAPDELKAIFSNGKAALVGPYEDRWGSWISGFAPVKDETGAILGVLGMDVAAGAVKAMVASSRLVGIVITFLLAVIGAGLGLVIQRNKDLAAANGLLGQEIAERQAAQEHLAESEEQYRNVVERANDGIAVLKDHTLLYANPRLAELLQTPAEDLAGRPLEAFLPPEQRERLAGMARDRARGEGSPGSFESALLTATGRTVPVEISAGLTPYQGESAVLFVVRDVTERKKAEEQLKQSESRYRELSITDDLTGLYNARHLYRQIRAEAERANRYGRSLSVLLLDLDDFKAFNDAYGHQEGDRLLASLGGAIRDCIRDSDSAYRYGGEEFVVLLPETGSEEARLLAERLRHTVAETPFILSDGGRETKTVSIGLAMSRPEEPVEDLILRADQRMYQAKGQGKNQVCADD